MKFLIIFLVLFSLPVFAKTEIFIKCVSLDNYLKEYYRYIEEETKLPKFYVYDSKNIDIHEITQWPAIVSYDKKNKIIKGTRFWDDSLNEGIEKFKIDLSKGIYLTDFKRKVIGTNPALCSEISNREFKKDLKFYLE